jgi:hypothetical protein
MRQRIVNKGYGSWMLPPNHPDHSYCVEYWRSRQPEIMTLAQAIDDPRIEPAIKEQCQEIMDQWELPPIYDNAEWVYMVLGYYRYCYAEQTPGGSYYPNVRLWGDMASDPLEYANVHIGVMFVRSFYPDYEPTKGDFEHAYYGEGIFA